MRFYTKINGKILDEMSGWCYSLIEIKITFHDIIVIYRCVFMCICMYIKRDLCETYTQYIPVSEMICQRSIGISTEEANHLANKYAREYKRMWCKRKGKQARHM